MFLCESFIFFSHDLKSEWLPKHSKKSMTQEEEERIEDWELWVVFSLTIDLTSEKVT